MPIMQADATPSPYDMVADDSREPSEGVALTAATGGGAGHMGVEATPPGRTMEDAVERREGAEVTVLIHVSDAFVAGMEAELHEIVTALQDKLAVSRHLGKRINYMGVDSYFRLSGGMFSANFSPNAYAPSSRWVIPEEEMAGLASQLFRVALMHVRLSVAPNKFVLIHPKHVTDLTDGMGPGDNVLNANSGNPAEVWSFYARMAILSLLHNLGYASIALPKVYYGGHTTPVAPTFKATARGEVGKFYFLKLWVLTYKVLVERVVATGTMGGLPVHSFSFNAGA